MQQPGSECDQLAVSTHTVKLHIYGNKFKNINNNNKEEVVDENKCMIPHHKQQKYQIIIVRVHVISKSAGDTLL